ncbi:hypothetical protein GGR56DRAFT_681937 [Xylariaceae sp. FL0804]|nr:hypothetical protein GGR56DRAFT_681937 [Xylariaceae sp. FL0804]
MRLYRWHRSQYRQLLNFIDSTMEQTSPLFSMAPQGPTTFTKFGELPPELRIKIWQHAMPEARTVVVRSPHTSKTQQQQKQQPQAPPSLDAMLLLPAADEAEQQQQPEAEELTWRSTTQIPALLHVSAEARHEALKHYRLGLGVGGAAPRVYVDFSRDTVFFGHAELRPDCARLWAGTADLARVRRLAVVPEGAWRALRWKGSATKLDGLRRLIFVHDSDRFSLGPLPQLVEDEDGAGAGGQLPGPPGGVGVEDEKAREEEDYDDAASAVAVEEQVRRIEEATKTAAAAMPTTTTKTPTHESQERILERKKRMQAAREEMDTLAMVLPAQWEKEPVLSTAVFKKSRGDRWIC